MAVPVAGGEDAGPAAAGAVRGGQVGDAGAVLGVQERTDAVAQDLGGRVPEEPLGVTGPARHDPVRVDEQRRGVGHVEALTGDCTVPVGPHGDPLCR
jgi:hypothetical protein